MRVPEATADAAAGAAEAVEAAAAGPVPNVLNEASGAAPAPVAAPEGAGGAAGPVFWAAQATAVAGATVGGVPVVAGFEMRIRVSGPGAGPAVPLPAGLRPVGDAVAAMRAAAVPGTGSAAATGHTAPPPPAWAPPVAGSGGVPLGPHPAAGGAASASPPPTTDAIGEAERGAGIAGGAARGAGGRSPLARLVREALEELVAEAEAEEEAEEAEALAADQSAPVMAGPRFQTVSGEALATAAAAPDKAAGQTAAWDEATRRVPVDSGGVGAIPCGATYQSASPAGGAGATAASQEGAPPLGAEPAGDLAPPYYPASPTSLVAGPGSSSPSPSPSPSPGSPSLDGPLRLHLDELLITRAQQQRDKIIAGKVL
ncbi:hypothetical protein GPECTOR_69g424 [Gonium pectorale]|uniref:Uncharacterized protein n=1 Tax=Gonium pectorale TaxID=33097 RepID=A0A150G3F9_GONPE|nr:hypothetical protein GPECTOR_69g424 [Gonium pectorale]|eukprot:KXZ44331.1 hypothetical protein GPECTOR_69g424 [Gonium pectorale]